VGSVSKILLCGNTGLDKGVATLCYHGFIDPNSLPSAYHVAISAFLLRIIGYLQPSAMIPCRVFNRSSLVGPSMTFSFFSVLGVV